MITLFEFLYYCLYRVFKLIKRVGVKDEKLTTEFYSILLATNTMAVSFPSKFFIPKGFFDPPSRLILLNLAFFINFVGWYFFCKYYFLKKENYIRIIDSYENRYAGKNKKMAIIGIIYAIGTFLSFYMTAVYIANGTFFLERNS